MESKTEVVMANKERQTLEQEIIEKVKKLQTLSRSSHYTLPFRTDTGGVGYVMVGNNYTIMFGMLAQARRQAGGK